jgi:RNA:NAD 2'-phosphotransferase (TPT1/KptA family)
MLRPRYHAVRNTGLAICKDPGNNFLSVNGVWLTDAVPWVYIDKFQP